MDTMLLTVMLVGVLLMPVAIKGGAPEAIFLIVVMMACVIALGRR